MEYHFAQSNPAIMMGKPVIVGTCITVESLLTRLAAGETYKQLLAAHPRLTPEAIQAALSFAAEALRADSRSNVMRKNIRRKDRVPL